MSPLAFSTHRRTFLSRLFLGCAAWPIPAAFAARRVPTPSQTEGPFYPDRLPLDTDNDLVRIQPSESDAAGTVTWLQGRILDARGRAVRNATVEIWQCDQNGAYLHSGSGQADRRDPGFQGFGRFVTGSRGEYLFRTIRPVPYPGRTPHIHFAVKAPGVERLTTQCYVEGDPGNPTDSVWKSIGDARKRAAVTVPFRPVRRARHREYQARFDVVLGWTPEA
ncbi:MAG: intradiol ring-cleavage dioxygenase [Verrucomicrobiales bacterium]|nr:intradiol ring-cleavage dioxygenase [Verrucomicrobiales bacterium]